MKTLIFLLLAVLSFSALAQTSLWKISKNNQQLYIGGTIHVLAKSDYPLPKAFDDAYQKSSRLVFETDISVMSSPEFQQKMLLAVSYQDGRTLKSVLSPSTYQLLENYCKRAGLPIDNLRLFKPGMLAITLLYIELRRLGIAEAGVDQYFTALGRADGKPLGQLESPDEQLGFLVNLGKGHENELVLQTIQEIQDLPAIMTQMTTAWRSGKGRELADLILKDMQKDFPGIYKDLIVDRNNAWVPKIEKMLKTSEVEMILVGAAHLVGKDGVIEQLRRRGYTIEQL